MRKNQHMAHKEADFEAAIVRSLVETGGYIEEIPRRSTPTLACSNVR